MYISKNWLYDLYVIQVNSSVIKNDETAFKPKVPPARLAINCAQSKWPIPKKNYCFCNVDSRWP